MTTDPTDSDQPDEIHDPADAHEAEAAAQEATDEVATTIEKGGDRTAEKAAGRGATSSSWWQRCRTIRDEPSGLERAVAGLLCVLLVVFVWFLLSSGEGDDRIVSAYALPSVGDTIKSFPQLWMDRALARSAVASVSRVMGGFAIAAAIAVPLGILAGCYFRVHAFFKPLSIFGRNVPVAALISLTFIWFGIGETQKVMFIVLASAAFIFFDTTNALHGVSNRFLDTAYCLGAKFVGSRSMVRAGVVGLVYALVAAALVAYSKDGSSWSGTGMWIGALAGGVIGFLLWYPILGHQVIAKVLMPLALPNIVNSLRLLFGLAFGYIMLAEVVNAKHGLGHLIITSERQGPREHIYLCLIFIALLAFAIDRAVFVIQKLCFPYKYSGKT
jgi:ABC-type nitrate/sulfonate/bicarbonate transport system permease component